jgi:hypothetical protein
VVDGGSSDAAGTGEGYRAGTAQEVFLEEPPGGGLGDLVGGYRSGLSPQPVTEVLDGTDDLADEGGGVTTANEELGERVNESGKWVAAEALHMMAASEERVEHGWLPSKEREVPRRASELCGALSAADQTPTARNAEGHTARRLELHIIGNSA